MLKRRYARCKPQAQHLDTFVIEASVVALRVVNKLRLDWGLWLTTPGFRMGGPTGSVLPAFVFASRTATAWCGKRAHMLSAHAQCSACGIALQCTACSACYSGAMQGVLTMRGVLRTRCYVAHSHACKRQVKMVAPFSSHTNVRGSPYGGTPGEHGWGEYANPYWHRISGRSLSWPNLCTCRVKS